MRILKQQPDAISKKVPQYIEFLHHHLGRFRDDPESIQECFNYLLNSHGGGFAYEAVDDTGKCLGLVIILKTHMKKFLPENFLVYIAVDQKCRGQGIGGKILDHIFEDLKGSICLHVEPDNPALSLYQRKGFTNKYLEMRYQP